MEQHPFHPLDSLIRNNPMSMLEALIPFVDYPLKLPLALLIKANEIRIILHTFRTPDLLLQCGLHNPSNNPVDMLSSLTGVSPDMIKTMFTLAETMGKHNSDDILSSFMGNEHPPDINTLFEQVSSNQTQEKPPTTDTLFENRLQQILSEYDMMQASQFTQDSER